MLREVQRVLETKFEKIVLIKADQDAQYSNVMSILDRLQRAGIRGHRVDHRAQGR